MLGQNSDYLDSGLRSKVETLKSEVAAFPTSPTNLRNRAAIVWDWANRFSLTGEPLPVECSFFMASIFVGNDVGEFSVLRRDPVISSRDLDEMIEELSIKEEHLGAIGKFSIVNDEPLLVGSFQTLEQVFTVGDIPLEIGAGILIARNGFVDHGIPQNHDPVSANFVTIRSDNSKAVFIPETIEMRGLRGGIRAPIPILLFRLAETRLEKGTRIIITYGNQSEGGPGFKIQSTSTDAFKLPIYVDFNGKNNFITFEYPGFHVIGKKTSAVHGFVPAIVGKNEAFELVIRSEDHARNRASGAVPAYQIYLGEELVASVKASFEAISKISNLKISNIGTHRFKIVSESGQVTWSDPIWVKSGMAKSIYWGDLHGHCEFADGQGTPDGFFKFGRDDAQLDFLCLSEHDIFLDDFKWKYLQDCLVRYEEFGKFVPLLAYEWTAPPKLGGHHNVYFRQKDGDIVGLHQATNLENLLEFLAESNANGDVLVIPHAHQAGDWRRADSQLVAGVEIASQHGSFEWFGKRYLELGKHIGFVGGSDNHQGHPGYSTTSINIAESKNGLTAAWARTLDAENIFAAIRERTVYATSGERILMQFSINGIEMGGTVDGRQERIISAAVAGTGPLSRILLRRGEKTLQDVRFHGSKETSKRIRIAFESSSEVSGHDNPRGYIIWRGWIDFGKNHIKEIDASKLFNWNSEFARLDSAHQNRMNFEVHTRGHANAIFLELDEAIDTSDIVIYLNETLEVADSRYIRDRDTLQATVVHFPAIELQTGRVIKFVEIGSHMDAILIEIVDPNTPWESEFTFTDSEFEIHENDFYTLYVEQLDGAQAWSSPIQIVKELGNSSV